MIFAKKFLACRFFKVLIIQNILNSRKQIIREVENKVRIASFLD